MIVLLTLQAAFGMAVSGRKLFISDWYNATISVYDTLTNSSAVIISEGVGQPASLFYSALAHINGNSQYTYTLRVKGYMLNVI